MKRISIILAGLAVFTALALPANAVVHEQVGAACGGHKDLSPPGISDISKGNFAKPVQANGVVIFIGVGPTGGPNLVIGDSPAAKYPPGTPILIDGVPQPLPDLDHPATHCKALR